MRHATDSDNVWASPVRSLRNGKVYGEFFDEPTAKKLSQGTASQPQTRILPTIAPSSFSLGPLANRPPQYQNQYLLVNHDGWLRLAAVSRRVLALPPELLAEIFYFCLPFHDERPHIPDPNDAPLVLCAVCRQWRNVALATPWLWSSICFDLSTLGTTYAMDSDEWWGECWWELYWDWEWADSWDLYIDLCCSWLSRARNTPLSISFDDDYVYYEDHALLLELVCDLSHQWRDINFPEDLPRLSLPVDGKYPFLEKLRMPWLPSEHPILSFRDAPRLHDVCIPNYTTNIQLPWHQLTKFHADRIDIEPCLELFCYASNLVDAHLDIPTYHPSTRPNYDTIFTLPQLEILNLRGTDDDDDGFFISAGMMLMSLLKCLKTPALKTFTLGPHYDQGSIDTSLRDISSFLSFISRSALQLHTLTLCYIPTTADTIIECLKAMPSVVHLELRISDDIYNGNPVIAQFTGYRDFLPELQRLQIAFPKTTTVDVSLVIGLLVWRCMTVGVTPLQSCRFAVYNDHATQLPSSLKPIKTHPVFLELAASGMELSLACI
ncbi:F-box domain-containing protein [Mycena sanguinolenta]|uniref:F-box domain-containing protein n=1 Tax=Mycena sanguinolenta TaxID=230812 RepID=A0A8H6YML7_9AGAR|nr:F-box domain-containing protein [Mycena sanguinolenta]